MRDEEEGLSRKLIVGGIVVIIIAVVFYSFLVGGSADLKTVEVAGYYALVGLAMSLLIGGILDWALEKRLGKLSQKLVAVAKETTRDRAEQEDEKPAQAR